MASFSFPKEIPDHWFLIILAVSLTLVAVFWRNWRGVLLGFCLMALALGAFLFEQKVSDFKDIPESRDFSGEVSIVNFPETKNGKRRIVGKDDSGMRVLIFESPYAVYRYGDVLRLSCQLEIPENFEDSRFDYRMYLAKDGISYVCRKPSIGKTGKTGGKLLFRMLYMARERLDEKITGKIPYPESGLLSGLLLGGDGGIPESLKEDFSRTGLSHIVAVSGYNVAIIAEYLMMIGIFFGLWRQQAFWLAILGIALFVVIIGLPPSAVRAGVMGGLLLLAMKEGRMADSKNAILLSAAIMLFANPLLLRFDVGFQLSFLATLGIIYFYPFLDGYLIKKQKQLNFIWEILGLTLAAQVFVLPIIFYDFGTLSIVSPLANLLVLPIVPFTMLLGFFFLLTNFLILPLSEVFAWLVFLPLKLETGIIHLLSLWRFSSIEVSFDIFFLVGWYLALGTFFFIMERKKKKRK